LIGYTIFIFPSKGELIELKIEPNIVVIVTLIIDSYCQESAISLSLYKRFVIICIEFLLLNENYHLSTIKITIQRMIKQIS
jgi:hypothetical protein